MAITTDQWERRVEELQTQLKEAIEILTEIGVDLFETGIVPEKTRQRSSKFLEQRAFADINRPKRAL